MADLVLDSTFAGCRIEAVAGRGGMGVVYRATQHPLGRTVALKVVAPERAADPVFHARFERETRLAASIDHPNVIPVYEAGESDGRLYLVMRWVDGGDLQRLIANAGRLEPATAAAIVAQVGAGLEAAHAAGLVHRDVKPANVLIAGEPGTGHVYLTDFGLVLDPAGGTRVTSTGDLLGTVDYMAPEQLEGGEVSPRTDVYALGCVLHAALTGRPPFRRETYPATMLAALNEPPPRASDTAGVPAAYDHVIERALAKRPGDRYSSAHAFVDALSAATGSAREAPAAARPAAAAAANGSHDAPTSALTAGTVALPAEPTARMSRSRGRRVPVAVALAALLAAAGAGAALVVAGDDTGSTELSAAEVRAAADGFAAAYGREDAGALRDVLTRDVTRVTPADRQRGRAAVLREYRGQFDANATEDYRLTGLTVRGGAAGRASGEYVASRTGAGPLTGRIVLGVRRDDGRPRVGLIALSPDG
ncbi:MAG: serine/threonine protein kinase [Thermoleophilaceae bacterium]|nr:serine/threonine protein kinase [Thermoleophilaceae bacterium]